MFAAVDAGTPIEVADAALDPLGLPMRPFALLQMTGPAVSHHVTQTLHAAFPDRFALSPNLARLVAAGRAGLLAPDGSPGPEAVALLEFGDSPLSAVDIRDRALTAIAEEIRLMLDEGAVAEVRDIDLCLILGAGWPFHLGGITPHLDRTGIAERVTGQRFPPAGVADRPS